MSQLDVDTVGEIGSKMKSSGRIIQRLGVGKAPVELQDYDMDQNYDEFVEQRTRIEQLRKQREQLQRERDEEFKNFRENNDMADYLKDLEQYGGGLEKDCCQDYQRCKKISASQQRVIDKITRLYEEKLLEDMDRMEEQKFRENNAMADYIDSINQYGGMLDDLPMEVIDEQLEKMNCRDRLSYCQTNRKSRDHCNSKRTFKKYIEPCRKKSKMNKTKRRAIEVSKRLQKKNHLENKIKSMQEEIRRREEMEERELLERLRQPREIEIRRNIDEDFEFDDDELNGFPTHR
jgi:hypothetical protein